MAKKQTLSLFAVTMINIIAVDSIRTLPISAQYGFSLLFYYLLAGLFFFIPSALVAAELGTGWPQTGGIYIWIKEAFGKKIAGVIIWLNWVYNLAWYPTIMALIAGVFAYIFNPSLAGNPFYIISVVLVLFWLATFLNCYGMKLSAWVSSFGAIVGTLLPMTLIIILALVYVIQRKPIAIDASWETFFPQGENLDKLGFFSSILFGLLGLEMAATHAAEMIDPKKNYPKSLFISVFVILTSIILASLSIAIVVPHNKLNLVVGIIQAFRIFFETFNMPYMTSIIAFAIVIGGLSGVSAWIIGPTKGIMVASKDKVLPKMFTKENEYGAPMNALMTQAVTVTVLSLLYLFLPSVNSTFIFLSIVTAQLAMVVYITLFAAAIALHYRKSDVSRAYKIPGGNCGIWLVAGSGIGISLLALVAGFVPPKSLMITDILTYEILLVGVMLLLSLLPFFFSKLSSK